MKKIEIKFTTVLIIILAIILTTATIYIFNTAQARYKLNKQIQIGYTTPDYYFDVSADITEISSFPATINITAKNHNGINYTTDNIVYTIGVDNPNYTVTAKDGKNTRTLTGGSKQQETYAVTINKNGTDSSESINLTFTVTKPYSDSENIALTISMIDIDIYGAKVTNYKVETLSDWRIFHKDEAGRIYLISNYYVMRNSRSDYLPTSTKGTVLNKGTKLSYIGNFANIISEYTGSDWIIENTNPDAQKLLSKFLAEYPTSTNKNMKAIAYMMDTDSWSKFVDNTYAEYAIGGPTLELFCASYRATHPDKYIECDSVTKNGYQVKWSNTSSYSNSVRGLTRGEYNGIYIRQENGDAIRQLDCSSR